MANSQVFLSELKAGWCRQTDISYQKALSLIFAGKEDTKSLGFHGGVFQSLIGEAFIIILDSY